MENVTEAAGGLVTEMFGQGAATARNFVFGLRCLLFASEEDNHKTYPTETLFSLCRRLSLLTFLLIPNPNSEAFIITMGSQQRDDEINVLVTGFLVGICTSAWPPYSRLCGWVTNWTTNLVSFMAI